MNIEPNLDQCVEVDKASFYRALGNDGRWCSFSDYRVYEIRGEWVGYGDYSDGEGRYWLKARFGYL